MNVLTRHPQLLGVEHVLSEVGDLFPDRHQACCWDDDLELRDEDAVSPRAIPDADIPVASIFLNNVGDVVARYFAQHFRWELVNSHDGDDSPECSRSASESESCALSNSEHKTLICHAANYFLPVKTLVEHSSDGEPS